MSSEIDVEFFEFIGIFHDVFKKEYCDTVVERFEKAEEQGFCFNRKQSEKTRSTLKADSQLFSNTMLKHELFEVENKIFSSIFWNTIYPTYADEYDILHDLDNHMAHDIKVQKILPGEGYHIWHPEVGGKTNRNRLLAYILYLNDIEDGGETEFKYQKFRVKPKAGTLVMWPAGFTHTHRGNPPLTNTKYIMTGWVEF